MNTSLKDYLMSLSPGAALDVGMVEFLLEEAWGSLRGGVILRGRNSGWSGAILVPVWKPVVENGVLGGAEGEGSVDPSTAWHSLARLCGGSLPYSSM
ncbi:hypothetical protein [Prosthecobacter sp.]|uniref:hypothetical protein n=1 Tax=Prosthecobacter sp. TaxID=1965333 RepID=UPI003782EB2F